jgi:hypothetical protein
MEICHLILSSSILYIVYVGLGLLPALFPSQHSCTLYSCLNADPKVAVVWYAADAHVTLPASLPHQRLLQRTQM